MSTIEINNELLGNLSFDKFDALCNALKCTALGKTKKNTWIIEAEDPISLFNLGGHLEMEIEFISTTSTDDGRKEVVKVKNMNTKQFNVFVGEVIMAQSDVAKPENGN